MTYLATKFEVATSNRLGGDTFTKNIIWPWLWVTQNVAQYALHHVTYSATKFEVAMSNRLGGDTFTRKYIIWPRGQGHTKCCPVPSTSCDLLSYKNSKRVWSGNTTNTNCRQTHGTARKSHTTITRHQEDKLSKVTSSLFPIKMIAKLEGT